METKINFTPFSNLTRGQYVFDAIKAAIFAGQLAPGAMLRELQLAKQFDVSQSVIREAFFRLEQCGLAVKIPHKGTSVVKLSEKEIRERIQIRTHLEILACHKAIKNMNDKDYEKLFAAAQEIAKAKIENQYYEASVADLNFHRYIWKKSENELLYDTLELITAPLFALISVKRSINAHNLDQVTNSHEEYIRTLQTGDIAKINEGVYTHTTSSYKLAGVEIDKL